MADIFFRPRPIALDLSAARATTTAVIRAGRSGTGTCCAVLNTYFRPGGSNRRFEQTFGSRVHAICGPIWCSMDVPLVLVVEDEFVVRMNAVSLLEEAGFGVLEAGSADEAIALLESRRDIRIVFTDINMPGSMDGLRLAHA